MIKIIFDTMDVGSGDLSSLMGNLDRHQTANLFQQAKMLLAAPKIKKNLEKLKESYLELKEQYERGEPIDAERAQKLIVEFQKLHDNLVPLVNLLDGNEDALTALATIQGTGGVAGAMQGLINVPQLIDTYIESIKKMINVQNPNPELAQ
jgi:hypothetical protein